MSDSVSSGAAALSSLRWPDGSQVLRFEDLEGAILLPATLRASSGADTSGLLVVDTGAGFLALDFTLSRWLGITDTLGVSSAVGFATRPLARMRLGELELDQVSPVLTVDAGVVQRATGRRVLGLLGQAAFTRRVVVLDYSEGTIVLMPPVLDEESGRRGRGTGAAAAPPPDLQEALSRQAVGVPFRLRGDGKILVSAQVGAADGGTPRGTLNLILDTGATKSVFFHARLDRRVRGWGAWPSLRGLTAPTLTGDANAMLVRVPDITLGAGTGVVSRRGMDAMVIGGDLGEMLSAAVGEPVDGLLGYSFVKHFRIALDYSRSTAWFDPSQGDVQDRPFEHSHVGLQLESAGGAARVAAVAAGSPAARAGVRPGDELVAVDGVDAAPLDLAEISRRLEGAPGSRVSLTLRRHGRDREYRLVRKRLL